MHTTKRIQRKLIHLVSCGSEFIEKIFQKANKSRKERKGNFKTLRALRLCG